jgi:molybdopterin biosynthesis enzyme
MTGAPVPRGADAIVMVEHVVREANGRRIACPTAAPGQFVNPQGSEARIGDVVIPAGRRLDYSSVALLATIGLDRVPVFRKPHVAVLATGDEIVEPDRQPSDFQIRNSNVYSLAASEGKIKCPSPFDFVAARACVLTFTTSTLASGTTAPALSWIVPSKRAVAT